MAEPRSSLLTVRRILLIGGGLVVGILIAFFLVIAYVGLGGI